MNKLKELLHEIIYTYFNAFKQITNYSETAKRKEFNFFFLCYFIFWFIYLLLTIVLTVAISFFITKAQAYIFWIIMVLGALYHIVHQFPLLALIKRRMNDVMPDASKLYFRDYLTVFAAQIITYFALTKMVTSSANSLSLQIVLTAIFMQLCSILLLLTWIYLMIKKGKN